MKNCEFITFISILACNIARNKTPEEIGVLSAVFTQLGDTLATFLALDALDDLALDALDDLDLDN